MNKKTIGIFVCMLLGITIVTASIAHSSEESEILDSELFGFRTARATEKQVTDIYVVYVAQEDKDNSLEFPEQVDSSEIPPGGGGYRTSGSTHCGGYTCGVTDCYTNGCYTCYPSAACYQTCYSNPCTYDNCPTNSGPTCGSTCDGGSTCSGRSCEFIPCETISGIVCITKEIMNDPGFISLIIPC
jgi:hypothetical protein